MEGYPRKPTAPPASRSESSSEAGPSSRQKPIQPGTADNATETPSTTLNASKGSLLHLVRENANELAQYVESEVEHSGTHLPLHRPVIGDSYGVLDSLAQQHQRQQSVSATGSHSRQQQASSGPTREEVDAGLQQGRLRDDDDEDDDDENVDRQQADADFFASGVVGGVNNEPEDDEDIGDLEDEQVEAAALALSNANIDDTREVPLGATSAASKVDTTRLLNIASSSNVYADLQNNEPDEDFDTMDGMEELGLAMAPKSKREKRRQPAHLKIVDYPPDIEILMSEANQAYVGKDYVKAIQCYERVIDKDPRIFETWNSLGMIQEETGNMDKALKLYMVAAHLKPKNGELWKRLGGMSKDLQAYQQAAYFFSKAITADKTDVDAIWDRAYMYIRLGENEKAIKGFLNVLKQRPHNLSVLEELVKLYSAQSHKNYQENMKSALSMYQAAFDHWSSLPDPSANPMADPFTEEEEEVGEQQFGYSALNMISELYIMFEEYEKPLHMIKSWSRRLQRRSHQTFWDIYDDDREFDTDPEDEEMQSSLMDARTRGLPIDLRIKLGTCRLMLEQVKEAKIQFRYLWKNAVEDFPDLYEEVSELYLQKHMWRDAHNVITAMQEYEELDIPRIWANNAECLRKMGQLEDAKLILEQTLVADPTMVNVKMMLAEVYEDLGELPKAMEMIKEVKRLHANRRTEEDISRREAREAQKNRAREAAEESARAKERRRAEREEDRSEAYRNQRILEIRQARERDEEMERINTAETVQKFNRLQAIFEQIDAKEKSRRWNTKQQMVDATRPERIQFLQTSRWLSDEFVNVKAFFPKDKSKPYMGQYSRRWRYRQDKLREEDELYVDRVSDLENRVRSEMGMNADDDQIAAGMDDLQRKHKSAVEELTLPTMFRGVSFDDWYVMIIRQCVYLTFEDRQYEAFSILDKILQANVFYSKPNGRQGITLVKMACAQWSKDYAKLVAGARYLNSLHRLRPDVLRIFQGACNLRENPSYNQWVNTNHAKYYLRQIKAMDHMLGFSRSQKESVQSTPRKPAKQPVRRAARNTKFTLNPSGSYVLQKDRPQTNISQATPLQTLMRQEAAEEPAATAAAASATETRVAVNSDSDQSGDEMASEEDAPDSASVPQSPNLGRDVSPTASPPKVVGQKRRREARASAAPVVQANRQDEEEEEEEEEVDDEDSDIHDAAYRPPDEDDDDDDDHDDNDDEDDDDSEFAKAGVVYDSYGNPVHASMSPAQAAAASQAKLEKKKKAKLKEKEKERKRKEKLSEGLAENKSSPQIHYNTKTGSVKAPVIQASQPSANLLMQQGHSMVSTRSFGTASAYYLRVHNLSPKDPLVNLCLAVQLLHRAFQRTVDNRQEMIIQAFTYLQQYYQVRMQGYATGLGIEYLSPPLEYSRTLHRVVPASNNENRTLMPVVVRSRSNKGKDKDEKGKEKKSTATESETTFAESGNEADDDPYDPVDEDEDITLAKNRSLRQTQEAIGEGSSSSSPITTTTKPTSGASAGAGVEASRDGSGSGGETGPTDQLSPQQQQQQPQQQQQQSQKQQDVQESDDYPTEQIQYQSRQRYPIAPSKPAKRLFQPDLIPSRQESYYNVGRAYHYLGLVHKAIEFYRKALDTPSWNAVLAERKRLATEERERRKAALAAKKSQQQKRTHAEMVGPGLETGTTGGSSSTVSATAAAAAAESSIAGEEKLEVWSKMDYREQTIRSAVKRLNAELAAKKEAGIEVDKEVVSLAYYGYEDHDFDEAAGDKDKSKKTSEGGGDIGDGSSSSGTANVDNGKERAGESKDNDGPTKGDDDDTKSELASDEDPDDEALREAIHYSDDEQEDENEGRPMILREGEDPTDLSPEAAYNLSQILIQHGNMGEAQRLLTKYVSC